MLAVCITQNMLSWYCFMHKLHLLFHVVCLHCGVNLWCDSCVVDRLALVQFIVVFLVLQDLIFPGFVTAIVVICLVLVPGKPLVSVAGRRRNMSNVLKIAWLCLKTKTRLSLRNSRPSKIFIAIKQNNWPLPRTFFLYERWWRHEMKQFYGLPCDTWGRGSMWPLWFWFFLGVSQKIWELSQHLKSVTASILYGSFVTVSWSPVQ